MIRILKMGAFFLFMSIAIVAAMVVNSFTAFAATGPQGACGNAITVDNTPAGASASCNMGVSVNFGSGFLSFTNDATVTPSIASAGTNQFSFNTRIVDLRNTNAGWRLEASSAGLTNTAGGITSTIPISFTSSTTTCIPTNGNAADCVATNFHAITLSPSTQYFLTTGPLALGTIVSGTFNVTTNATYIFTGSEPAGTYTGNINIALVNAF